MLTASLGEEATYRGPSYMGKGTVPLVLGFVQFVQPASVRPYVRSSAQNDRKPP